MSIETVQDWLRSRGTSNVAIALWKDIAQNADAWGDAMSFGFAVCDWATEHGYGYLIPDSLGYRPSAFGPDTDDWAYREVDNLVTGEDLVFPGIGEDALAEALPLALNVLSRYLELCKLNGLDY